MTYLLDRLAERSTWQGLAALAGAFGFAVRPDLAEAIAAFGIATAGLIHMLFPQSGKLGK